MFEKENNLSSYCARSNCTRTVYTQNTYFSCNRFSLNLEKDLSTHIRGCQLFFVVVFSVEEGKPQEHPI
jgi:hypothetical protein